MHTNAYTGGGGGLSMTKTTHFVCMFIILKMQQYVKHLRIDDTSQRGIHSA